MDLVCHLDFSFQARPAWFAVHTQDGGKRVPTRCSFHPEYTDVRLTPILSIDSPYLSLHGTTSQFVNRHG
jgi:hypothetical protein